MPHPDDCPCWRSQLFTFCLETPKPDFWFGELVDFCWIDESSNQSHSERGEIVGVAWNPPENQWEYIVVWLSSTAYPVDAYPVFDVNFVGAGVLCKL